MPAKILSAVAGDVKPLELYIFNSQVFKVVANTDLLPDIGLFLLAGRKKTDMKKECTMPP
jgi:hypothetical protein